MKDSLSLYLLLLILVFAEGIFAQKLDLHKVTGESTVRVENNETYSNAKERAEELAKLDAIQKAFGSYIEQNTDISVEGGKVNYNIMAGTKMKADWIKTTKIRFTDNDLTDKKSNDNSRWIKCNIEGLAREVTVRAKIDFLTLRCPLLECSSGEFKNNQQLYVYFRSPVDGFVSIFIDEGDVTRRLLPYESMGVQSAIEVSGDKEYIFFDKNKNTDFNLPVDEIELYTNNTEEHNTIYLVFSEEPFVKPLLNESKLQQDHYVLPRSLPSSQFQEWLAEGRMASTSFQDKKVKIKISKK
jgi:hypothetical protein